MKTVCPKCFAVFWLDECPAPGDETICRQCGQSFEVAAHLVVEYDWLYQSEEYVVEWQL
jgi:hypothetical protein